MGEESQRLVDLSATVRLCKICDVRKPESEIRTIEVCMHEVCTECLQQYVSHKIGERQTALKCPFFNCETHLSDSVVQESAPSDLYTKYIRFRWVDSMQENPLLRWCPKADCEGYGLLSPPSLAATCNTCGLAFCSKCGEQSHDGLCNSAESDLRAVKFCPKCRVRVERAAGCSHMACPRCSFQWCWLCGQPYFSMHFLSCSFERSKLSSPSTGVIAFFIFLPFFAVLTLFILSAMWLPDVLKEIARNTRAFTIRRWMHVPLWLLSITLAPVPILLICAGLGVAFMADIGRYLRETPHMLSPLAKREGYWLLLTVVMGLVLSPLLVAAILIALALGPVVGVALIVQRCCRSSEQGLLPVSEVPGYRMGD